jgi:hypothetical protein
MTDIAVAGTATLHHSIQFPVGQILFIQPEEVAEFM